MRASKYFVVFYILILVSCNNNNENHFYLGKRTKCETIDTNIFFARMKTNWPTRKPISVADAVRLLDSVADDNFKCTIVKITNENLYFNLGLKIRNEWVRNGTSNIKDQLFNKLKLSSTDYSSSLIIDIYRQLLTHKKIDLVNHYAKSISSQNVQNELIKIQEALSK